MPVWLLFASTGFRRFWSLKLGGKFAEQVAAALKARGVSKVKTTAQKGLVTKKDREQYKGL